MDEKPQIQAYPAHRPGAADDARDARAAQRHSFDCTRHGTIDLFAELNIAAGKVISKLSAQYRAVGFRDFPGQIDRQTDLALAVHMICDSLSAHKAPAVRRWLLAHPRFVLHFTPTYSVGSTRPGDGWPNCSGGASSAGCSARSTSSPRPSKTGSSSGTNTPRLFKWTKTADQIIDRICHYCSRISGPGH